MAGLMFYEIFVKTTLEMGASMSDSVPLHVPYPPSMPPYPLSMLFSQKSH